MHTYRYEILRPYIKIRGRWGGREKALLRGVDANVWTVDQTCMLPIVEFVNFSIVYGPSRVEFSRARSWKKPIFSFKWETLYIQSLYKYCFDLWDLYVGYMGRYELLNVSLTRCPCFADFSVVVIGLNWRRSNAVQLQKSAILTNLQAIRMAILTTLNAAAFKHRVGQKISAPPFSCKVNRSTWNLVHSYHRHR